LRRCLRMVQLNWTKIGGVQYPWFERLHHGAARFCRSLFFHGRGSQMRSPARDSARAGFDHFKGAAATDGRGGALG